MTKIIAGRFDDQIEIENALEAINEAGYPSERLGSFFVNPAGQHDRYAIGGDEDESPGAQDSKKGIAAGGSVGGAVGVAVGAVAMPLVGPAGMVAGALVGAHVGNLVGSLSQMDDDGGQNITAVRHAGMMLAVSTPDQDSEQLAIKLLHSLGAHDIEQGEGQILGGDWPDFDPLLPPRLVKVPSDVDRVDFQ